jgi:tRNA-2-methylthio-N6-dimethylallyladenosine synthase
LRLNKSDTATLPALIVLALVFVFSACKVYTFNSASIPPEVKTVKIGFIENKARYINPQLSPKLTDRIQQKIVGQTRLTRTNNEDAHYQINGYIGTGQKAVNVLLSRDETYADISPVRLDSNGITAFVSIMRGCNNMCSFCVVPFTRGRERSRDNTSIVAECRDLFERGFKEVTLLGQNVDSYYYVSQHGGDVTTFALLLEEVARISPELRVRFSTSHPKDITDEVLHTMARYENICKYIHLPVQSGSTRVLQLMNRTYTREWYMAKVNRIREIMPDCGITSDIIAGFCTETEEDHQATLQLMEYSRYDMSYMYFYSERPGTLAARRYQDDIPLETKKRRLAEIVKLQNQLSQKSYGHDIGKTFKVLIEGNSKRSDLSWSGKTSHSKVLVFAKGNAVLKKGDYAWVKVTHSTGGTLIGEIDETMLPA